MKTLPQSSRSVDALSLDAVLDRKIAIAVERELAKRMPATAREYNSRDLLPAHVSARVFRRIASKMTEGVRVEGVTPRNRVYFVTVEAWHRARTAKAAPRLTLVKTREPSDDELADLALADVGLRPTRRTR